MMLAKKLSKDESLEVNVAISRKKIAIIHSKWEETEANEKTCKLLVCSSQTKSRQNDVGNWAIKSTIDDYRGGGR